jgi:hypothetical protein
MGAERQVANVHHWSWRDVAPPEASPVENVRSVCPGARAARGPVGAASSWQVEFHPRRGGAAQPSADVYWSSVDKAVATKVQSSHADRSVLMCSAQRNGDRTDDE